MGKGDKRTMRGKIFKGSYGKTRPHDPKKKPVVKTPGQEELIARCACAARRPTMKPPSQEGGFYFDARSRKPSRAASNAALVRYLDALRTG